MLEGSSCLGHGPSGHGTGHRAHLAIALQQGGAIVCQELARKSGHERAGHFKSVEWKEIHI